MAPMKALDVGQCGVDHPRIKRMIETGFDAEVDRAHTALEAFNLAKEMSYDLILVNRILDSDGDSGIALIRKLKADHQTSSTPVVLVSNYASAQMEAIEAGAIQGFGKNALDTDETRAVLTRSLTPRTS